MTLNLWGLEAKLSRKFMTGDKMIKPEKWNALRERMQHLSISEDDLREQFVIGSGKGGQHLHKTASCVNLLHLPTMTGVKCQQSRSRENNRYYARQRLCDKIENQIYKEKSEQQKAFQKIRRQKRKRSVRAKQKILQQKHHRSRIKEARKKPDVTS